MAEPAAPVVFITGASRGIGAAAALAFGRAGWRVAIAARSVAGGQQHMHQLRRPDGGLLAGSLAQVASQLQTSGAVVSTHAMDLMNTATLGAALDAAIAHHGRIDLLINNAVYQDRESNALLADLHDDALARTLQGNVIAPTHLLRHLLPHFVEQAGGQVINVTSGAGQADPPVPANQGAWGFAYGASKAALARLAGVVNTEYGQHNIRAFSVNPGLVSTEAVTATLGDGGLLEKRYGAMPPEAIAQALLWLATAPQAAALAKQARMIDLQPLVREQGLWPTR